MRVAAVTTSFPRHEDDHAGRFVHDLHAGLVEEGHCVVTVAPAAPGAAAEELTEAGRVVRVAYGSPRRMDLFYGAGVEGNWRGVRGAAAKLRRFARAAAAVLREEGRAADVLVGHWLWPGGRIAVRAAGRRDVPVLGVAHGADVRLLARPVVGRLLARGLRGRLRGVLCTSRAGAAVVTRRLDLPVDRLLVRPMGADPAPFSGAGRPPEGWPEGYLLGVGRLVPEKGLDLLVRAAAALGRPVVVAGAGPEAEGLAALAARTGARLLLPGALGRSGVARAMAGAAVVVVPSRGQEGCPVVAVEALLAGRPLVAARTGGLEDLLDDPWLFHPDDVDDLVRAVRAALVAARPPRTAAGFGRRDAARDLMALVGGGAPAP